ncbi:serine/threonine protein kinase [Chondromyces crocatus]|uniref:Protein kinase domain-containing protein n=1 Tax=Chondromyces crocatus TaxID=52 RepID=A0A0K1ECD6_CHOCO|nr:serine/threonine-protein kinase [Chondromyces crocatus]AKT38546.1 uncharacterized protein CMC5_026930 [Chondromyces crocatus]
MTHGEGSARLRPGERFLRFHILHVLGEGGLGVVYAALDGTKRCALKLVKAAWIDDEGQRRRLVREGALLELIRHPNMVEVHETGITREGIAWMRMELLEGATLRQVLRRHRRLSPAVAFTWLRQACHGVYQCHAMGVIHRDLKPENLFITRDGTVKVLDLGIAKLYGNPDTLDQQTHGTPLYMAPEQIRAEPASFATDVYALALMAYEIFAGHHPFKPPTHEYEVHAVYARQLLETPPSLVTCGAPVELAAVIRDALHKEPARRPCDALVLAERLNHALRASASLWPELSQPPGLEDLRTLIVATTGGGMASAGENGRASGERGPSPGAERRGCETERLPDAFRDPSCIEAVDGRHITLSPFAVTPPALRLARHETSRCSSTGPVISPASRCNEVRPEATRHVRFSEWIAGWWGPDEPCPAGRRGRVPLPCESELDASQPASQRLVQPARAGTPTTELLAIASAGAAAVIVLSALGVGVSVLVDHETVVAASPVVRRDWSREGPTTPLPAMDFQMPLSQSKLSAASTPSVQPTSSSPPSESLTYVEPELRLDFTSTPTTHTPAQFVIQSQADRTTIRTTASTAPSTRKEHTPLPSSLRAASAQNAKDSRRSKVPWKGSRGASALPQPQRTPHRLTPRSPSAPSAESSPATPETRSGPMTTTTKSPHTLVPPRPFE